MRSESGSGSEPGSGSKCGSGEVNLECTSKERLVLMVSEPPSGTSEGGVLWVSFAISVFCFLLM